MSYNWLDPETTTPSGYGSGGLNIQTLTPYDDPSRAVGAGNLVSGGMTGYEIQNNFLNLGEVILNVFNRTTNLELGQHAIAGDEVYKGTLLYIGRKNGYGAFFAGGQAILPGTEDIKDASAIYGAGGDLQTSLQFKIGVKQSSLLTVTIPNTALENITTRDTLLSSINASLLNDSINTSVTWYGYDGVEPDSYPISIANGDSFNIVFDEDETRYSYTYEYLSSDGSTPLSIANQGALISFLQTALNQAVSDADSGVEVPPITKFISGSDFAVGTGTAVKLTLVTKQVDTDGSSKGSLVVAIKGEIPVAAGLTTDESVAVKAFDFSAVLTATYTSSGGDEFLSLVGGNNESSKIVISNSGIDNANALFYIIGAVGAGTYEQLNHTKAPAVSSDNDTAFSTQLLFGGSFVVPKLTITSSWANTPIKIHADASTDAEKQGALYISLTPYDTTDETSTLNYGGVFSPGNLAIPMYASAGDPPIPSPEYSKFMYNTADKRFYIYDTVANAWFSSNFVVGASLVIFEDDFLGYKFNQYIAGENTTAPWVTVETDINLAPLLVADTANGVVQLTLDSDDVTQQAVIYWGDQLSLSPTQGLIFECRAAFPVLPTSGGGENTWTVFGLASATNGAGDNVDTIAVNAWFRVESDTQTTLLYESDDTSTDDNDNIVSGVTLAPNVYHIFRIDMTNLATVGFYVDNVLKGTTDMSALTTETVQPYFCVQKIKAAANTGVGTLHVDLVRIWTDRT